MTNDIDIEYYKDIEIFKQQLDNKGGNIYVIRGGWTNSNPNSYMDNFVSLFMERKSHNQFVEIHLDIPQVRVIIEGINSLDYKTIEEFIGKHHAI